MLIVDQTTRSLRVRCAANHVTTPLRCVTSWRDTTTTTFTPGSTLTSTTGTTGVEIAPSPAASTQRVVDYVSVLNTDTIAHTVTVYLFNGTTNFDLITVVLAVGERIEYVEGAGFQTFNAAGAAKTIVQATQNIASPGWSTAMLGTDQVNNNATANTMQDVTGLSFPVVAGQRYWFEFFIMWASAALTTGARFAINGPGATQLAYRSDWSLSSTSRTINEAVAYDIPAAASASVVNLNGNIATIEGFIQPAADGNVIARFASEVASSAITVRQGSFVRYLVVS